MLFNSLKRTTKIRIKIESGLEIRKGYYSKPLKKTNDFLGKKKLKSQKNDLKMI